MQSSSLLIATKNKHKVAEIAAILKLPGLSLLSAADLPNLPEVEENGATFLENAALKALAAAEESGMWCLADDSGLEVEALGGAPGVNSARYAGVHGDDERNNRKLLAELMPFENRAAGFRCALALASPNGELHTLEGFCAGRIIREPRGSNGFGYDPLFAPEGENRTFGEMREREKNRLSHRSRALSMAAREWKDLLTRI